MSEEINNDRRRFFGSAIMTLAAGDRADNAGFRPLAAPHDPPPGGEACHV